MATVLRRARSTAIQFHDAAGKRRTLGLGRLTVRQAETVGRHIENLVAAAISQHAPLDETSRWLGQAGARLVAKLAKLGLCPAREGASTITLAEFLEEYVARRSDVKPATLVNWGHTQRCLLEFFGTARRLATITPAEAGDWVRWLRTGAARDHRYGENQATDGLAENTVRKRTSNAKQFFADAVERGLIARNPFNKLKGAVGANRSRDFFVTREMALAVLSDCPDHEWRLLFALSRFAGLRCPSEHLALRWGDIDWERGRMVVRSPKTEHHAGKGVRIVPIFPELRPYLEAAWDSSTEGQVHVITRYRDAKQNLRTQLGKIIVRAGLTPWPKLWQNLRASRATELASEYPAHVASAWMGHSRQVAERHYLQVTDADFQKALHQALHQPHPNSVSESQPEMAEPPQPLAVAALGTNGDSLMNQPVGGTGLEPVTSTV